MKKAIKEALKLEFGSFLAHPPAYPDRFWGQAADAVLALFTATSCESDPTTFVFPPQPDGPVWDRKGRKWEKKGSWWYPDNGHIGCPWSNVLAAYGPLTSTPPANQAWRIGDTISQGDDLRALPTGTILKAEHKTMAGKIVHKIGSCELEVTGIHGSTYPASIQYPLTIIWLPEEDEA